MIDLSDDHENADDSIRVKCEFDSNTIDFSAFSMTYGRSDRGRFRKIIEFGIQTARIFVLGSSQSVTVFIEPHFTTIRRS
jgi:hypothetical protein